MFKTFPGTKESCMPSFIYVLPKTEEELDDNVKQFIFIYIYRQMRSPNRLWKLNFYPYFEKNEIEVLKNGILCS